MPIKQNSRDMIEESYKWDLSLIYKTDNDWYNEYNKLSEQILDFSKYKGNILNNAENLLNTLEDLMYVERILSKLYVYAYMRSDEDTGNTYYQKLKGEIDNLAVTVSEITSFVVPELINGDYEIVSNYILEIPKLSQYKLMLTEIYRSKKYTLTDNEEKILSKLSNVLGLSNDIATLARNSDLVFGTISDEDGQLVELTNSNYSKYIESPNREVRKNAFLTLYKGYETIKNTLAKTLSGEVESNNAIANIRGFENALEMSLFGGNIDSKIYHNLIKVVNENLDVLHKYYQLKKDCLEVEELNLYDVHVPIVGTLKKTYSFDKAKELINNALKILGENYLNDLNRAFNEKWIDIYPNMGKKSGAYSWGCYDSNPYILLNYQDRIDDVSTLAHELGHSMHSLYSRKNNDYQDSDYKIFVAEVASIVNELLLYNYMLETTTDKDEKLGILNNMMELFKSTLYRQTMFAEFELDIYERANNNEILTHELLSKVYYDLNEKYFGKNVLVNDEIKYEWARIPHFYMNFYVYQYATGLSAACAIVKDIIAGKPNAIENYLEFLKTGGRDYPVELLKIAGVDMSEPKVIEDAISLFDDIIKQFIELRNS
ncbi:MAG: oligoendopeptidase F [Bacilli bacterium]|nr:oligoendopeptidase F [Bacilli bacterium]MDD4547194.1 oligoendopeptidase F [Bacilli bacterium]